MGQSLDGTAPKDVPQLELKTLAAHLTKVPPADVLVVRFRADNSIVVVINPGKKLYFTPQQIARATAELQPKPVPTTPPTAPPAAAPVAHPGAQAVPPEAAPTMHPRGARQPKL